MSNLIVHDPRTCFVEDLRANLSRKFDNELRMKVRSLFDQIAAFVGKNIADAFISYSSMTKSLQCKLFAIS